MTNRTEPQRVMITGGAGGIGKVIAETFLADGAKVAICDIDAVAVNGFQAAYPEALARQADISDPDQMASFFQAIEGAFGGIDVVCANGGEGGPAGRIETLKLTEWQRCLSNNLDAAYLACAWAAPLMRAQKSGVIIFTVSTGGQFGYPHRSPYAAAKWALVGLTKTLAMEMGEDGIRVNAVSPGSVEGDRMGEVIAKEANARGVDPEVIRTQYVKGVSMKTWVSPQDIANAVHFLASDKANKISGQILAIDGHTETLVI